MQKNSHQLHFCSSKSCRSICGLLLVTVAAGCLIKGLVFRLNHAMQCYLVCDLTRNLKMLWQQRTDYGKLLSRQKSDVLPHD
jgi:hypothetical protein